MLSVVAVIMTATISSIISFQILGTMGANHRVGSQINSAIPWDATIENHNFPSILAEMLDE
jgi:hypothetical protein